MLERDRHLKEERLTTKKKLSPVQLLANLE